MSIMICGLGRHGKDEVGRRLANKLGMGSTSSSRVAAEMVIYPRVESLYPCSDLAVQKSCVASEADKQALIQDLYYHRHEDGGREKWFDAICDYNKFDACRLMKDLYERCEIYVGLRSLREFNAGKEEGLFKVSIWVDSSERVQSNDKTCEISESDCDMTIDNNGSLSDLDSNIDYLVEFIRTVLC